MNLVTHATDAKPAIAGVQGVHGQTLQPHVQTLKLQGRFDAYETPRASAWLNERIDAGQTAIVVNLAEVQFIDSAALSALVQAMKRARQQNGDCRLCELQQPVRIIFELTRLDKAFEIFSSEAKAIQSYALESTL